ncbi:uncharacterized protein LOC110459950 isoform X1 [Mizuhopecten yessoensis]|uniref:uncharacterized protein LOC110459950 isoform X1 n=1 Tax=Mizuhopecten yessoensis TaxID=6573 RepID=UPI000B458D05|nr:uncharacterized protein LOC110459950 isoform X1 [Mizuhopecten yessoensis]
MNYQKFYTNGIHSSSLLCQLATMWKSQTLCDAIIKTGNINTKAHRLVLVAACPMLQSMDNASIGSHLEVRLASEIKQDSVNMFLQYLYEGFMMLTEDNHKDIEKIARLLQVDSVIKCCADFCKSLHEKTGLSIYSAGQFKYTSHDMLEFKHVRVSGMQKTVQDSMMKRHSDFQRPNSPGSKRPRMHRPGSPSDGQRGDNMYGHSSHSDSDRVPRLGLGSFPGAAGRNLQPGVIEVIEDSLELVQTEPVERDPVTGRPLDSRPPVQKTVAISVASQVTGGDPDLQIVNVSGVRDSSSSSTSRTHLSTATHTTSTPIARDSRGSSAHSSFSSQQSSQSMRSDIPMTSSSRVSTERAMPQMPRPDIQRSMQNQFASDLLQQQQKQSTSQYPSIPQALIDMDFTANKQKSSDVFPTSLQKATDVFPTSMPKPSDIVFPGMPMGSQQNSTPMAQSKPFAAGSAGQANQSVPVHINTSSSSSSPITSLPPVSPVIPEASLFGLSASSPSSKSSQPTTSRSESMERPSSSERLKEERPPTAADLIGPDISIVKIESTDKDETGVLDMYVDTGDDGEVHPHGMEGEGDQTYEGSDYDVEEPPGEMEGSNEGSNLSGDQNAWYLNTMKGVVSQGQESTLRTCRSATFPPISPVTLAAPITPTVIPNPASVQRYLPATQKRTIRDVKFVKDWLQSVKLPSNMEEMDTKQLNSIIGKFYQNGRTKDKKKFTRNTLVCIRASLNRYLQSACPHLKDISMIKDPSFVSSNRVLEKLMADERGRAKVIKKIPLTAEDLQLLVSSNTLSLSSPASLQWKVWTDLVIHFGIKGSFAVGAITKDTFKQEQDGNGKSYYHLNMDQIIEKVEQHSEMKDWYWYSRMYEVKNSPHCPVKSLSLYLSRLDSGHSEFFQKPLVNEKDTRRQYIWYSTALGYKGAVTMMASISKNAALSRVYTNICMRATGEDMVTELGQNMDTKLLSHSRPVHQEDVVRKEHSIRLHKTFYKVRYTQNTQSDAVICLD